MPLLFRFPAVWTRAGSDPPIADHQHGAGETDAGNPQHQTLIQDGIHTRTS